MCPRTCVNGPLQRMMARVVISLVRCVRKVLMYIQILDPARILGRCLISAWQNVQSADPLAPFVCGDELVTYGTVISSCLLTVPYMETGKKAGAEPALESLWPRSVLTASSVMCSKGMC